MYSALKLVHVTAVVLSGAGFVTRYALLRAHRLPRSGFVRVAPHVVDAILLASALTLAWVGGFRPLEVPWLEAKLAGLVLYIVAGTIALKRGRTPARRATAFAVALLAYAYIVSVALTKHPLGWLAGGMA
ncbi:MAG TPA: SirB2 family protein [Burkholderiaceae bacterium]|nr:SirB2 family protein [Burkholderiaceae bacterium]